MRPTVHVVAIDGSSCAEETLFAAASAAQSRVGPVEVHVIHVLDGYSGVAVSPGCCLTRDFVERGRVLLDEATRKLAADSGARVVGHLAAGNAWREIVQLATSLEADLVIVGTSGRRGMPRIILGSVAEAVVRHAPCPVFVARAKEVYPTPHIEPPCEDCASTQNRTDRERLWCERHSISHPRGRTHYELPPTFGLGSTFIRPHH